MRITLALMTALLLGGCDLFAPPPPPEPPCPLPVTDAPGFTITLPCGSTLQSEAPPGANVAWFRDYADPNGVHYLLIVLPPNSFQASVGDPGNFRFVGSIRTTAGDRMVRTETVASSNQSIQNAIGLLASGSLLSTSVGPLAGAGSAAGVVFASVDLLGTDGAGIDALAKQGAPTLLAPATDLLALLSNKAVYRLASTVAPDVPTWASGDSILVHRNMSFTSTPQAFFLTQIGQWISMPADYVGQASLLTIAAINHPLVGDTQIVLSDASIWNVLPADNYQLTDWAAGDAVGLAPDASLRANRTHLILNRKNGEAVAVGFAG